MYFLSMKIEDKINNNEIPLMSEHNESVIELVRQATIVYELLTRRGMRDITVIDDNFDSKHMSDAGMDIINDKIVDFEWSFLDKYDRNVKCYITRNV